jgi:hypothetical protein
MSELDNTVNEDEIDENAGASFGDPSYVAGPVTPAGGTNHGRTPDKTDGEKALVKQGSSTIKTKAGMIGAMVKDMQTMSAANVKSAYKAFSSSKGEMTPIMQGNSKMREDVTLTTADLDVSADVEAMFGDETLSEDFKTKATNIFETAIVAKVNEVLQNVLKSESEEIQEQVDTLVDNLDSYLDYVAEAWMETNELAITSGIRSDISEDFMTALKNVFIEHHIDIPEDKVDVVEEISTHNEALEDALNEEMNKNIALVNELDGLKAELIFADVAEGMALTDSEKLLTLAEAVTFEDDESYRDKVEQLKESYFNQSDDGELNLEMKDVDSGNDEAVELTEDAPTVNKNPEMDKYMSSISRTVGVRG